MVTGFLGCFSKKRRSIGELFLSLGKPRFMGALCCSPCRDELVEELSFSGNSIHRQCGCVICIFHHLFSGYNAMFYRLEGRHSPSPLPRNSLSEHSYTRVQRDGLIFRRDKSMTNLREASQPLRRNKSSSSIESSGHGKKWNSVDPREDAAERTSSVLNLSSEDEDFCPTCLDGYTPENPKILTKCSHHFHLSCIYEWLDRSDLCPICGKEMEFNENP
ncbi:PREDICTED: E3 ubiquitin-protein ligase At3g02290-like [Tarenaya hassleriana]|uniref:E3 ubiquitin-protein ligase At3g02290-like n=1 Tax=Tarenaya hassleriana TaxID=28532 RepID=UPI00053C4AA2|nr:PREDICTED: E3 ubiquitin-protein ligase At3g02290-like [Tarenaya hassleriana]